MIHRTPSGTRDVLPDEMRELRAITSAVHGVFDGAGYGELYTPALEYESVERMGGGQGVYRMFDETTGEMLALRSDMTVPIARVAHADLTMRVTEYVVLHVLMHHRRQRLYDAQQRQRLWRPHDQPAASEVSVGVMGLGAIGSNVVGALGRLGFKTTGWSRTAKNLPGVETFYGSTGLDAFLARTEILVCLLPRTHDTKGILKLALFRKLKRDGAAGGAFLINAGRGPLQVDADIIAALDEGTLKGATLDVFPQEPLPSDSPLWTHPKVTVTPHNAGDISPRVFAPHVIAQIERFERGAPLDNVVDRVRGY